MSPIVRRAPRASAVIVAALAIGCGSDPDPHSTPKPDAKAPRGASAPAVEDGLSAATWKP